MKTTQTNLDAYILKCFLSDATKANFLLLSRKPATVNEQNSVPQYSCKKVSAFPREAGKIVCTELLGPSLWNQYAIVLMHCHNFKTVDIIALKLYNFKVSPQREV